MASTTTLQQLVTSIRAYPQVTAVLGTSGWTQEPSLTIANDTMQRMLAQALNWKFNRANVPAFLTVQLQQDYVSNVTNLGWLEQGWKIDINNTTTPKPVFSLETVRDLGQTSYQGSPFNVSWVPNSLAIMGTWQANTKYQCGYGQAQLPSSPIQQFIDANGNILFINSATLGLSINSPGGTQSIGAPYGTSGNSQPSAPANSAAGTTVTDNTVTWTVADPNGYAMRVAPLAATNGLCWLMQPVYQKKPPILTSLQNTLSPIPDEFLYLFRQGFLAMLHEHAGSKRAAEAFAKWQEDMFTALRSGDREREDASLYPTTGLMSGSSWAYGPLPIGPAWPYDYFGGL